LYAAVQGTQVLRASESKGLFDLWFAAGRSRSEVFRDRVLSFVVALVAIVVLIYLGTGLSGALSDEPLWLSALGQCVAVAAVGLVAFSFSLLVSQFLHSTRAAAGFASVFLVASYFIANISDSLGAGSFLRFFSPFFYYLQWQRTAATAGDLRPRLSADRTASTTRAQEPAGPQWRRRARRFS
jgi:ABC-2 type transport system permease protein